MKEANKREELVSSKIKIDIMTILRQDPDLAEQLSHYLRPDERIVLEREAPLIKLHSDNYMVVDTDVLNIVKNCISDADYKRLFSLGVFLKTKYNILFNHTRPFTVETLSKQLGINVENTIKFVKRMVKEGIMAYTVCAPLGVEEKLYAINPQLIRRGKHYDRQFIRTFFKDFTPHITNNEAKDENR